MSFRFETTGFTELAAHLHLRSSAIQAQVQVGLERSINKLQDMTEARSSGRPGPNIITGSYHDSWFTAVADGQAVLSNFQPQALRLEFGFVGVDSLGRHYSQPPYAHLGPAVIEFQPEFGDILTQALRS